jgi:hypothetical protein
MVAVDPITTTSFIECLHSVGGILVRQCFVQKKHLLQMSKCIFDMFCYYGDINCLLRPPNCDWHYLGVVSPVHTTATSG